MNYYLCKHCGMVTNCPPEGECEYSPIGDHKWVQGSSVDDFMHRNWKSPEGALAGIATSRDSGQESLN